MPLIRVPNAGSVGVNKDLSNHELPINAWTDCKNIRFLDGYAWQYYGHGEVYASPSVVPYHVIPCKVADQIYWLYAGANKVYAVKTDSGGVTTHTNLTRQTTGVDVDYTAIPNAWTSTLLGGIPILNNGTDDPQMWNLNIANRMTALTNWPANTKCKSLRSYKNYLVALNVTKSGTNYPYMVKWSHPADPGTVPSTWDIADATKDSGEADLSEGYDQIVDGLQLRDSFIIYKENSVWNMTFTGGVYVFNFKKVLGISGAMNRNCIVELDGIHFVLTGSDVVVHDGQTANSIMDKQTRRFLFQTIDVDNAHKCFVFKNNFLNEVYVCYPEIGQTDCTKAMVWNWKDKTISFRDIPNLLHASSGIVNTGLTGNWNQDSAPWSADLSLWNQGDFTPSTARVLMASADQKLFLLDASASFDGVIPQAYLERQGLSFDSPESRKLIRGIRPRITGNVGDTVIIKVGYSDDPYIYPNYTTTMTHVIGSNVKNDCLVNGRYIAIRFETGTAYQFRIDSYDIDVEIEGAW